MGRIRSYKPELFSDPQMAELDANTVLAYLWCHSEADDAGRFEHDPVRLKMGCHPLRSCTVDDCRGMLAALADRFEPYEKDGHHYAVIRRFFRHQRPNPFNVRPGGTWRPAPKREVVENIGREYEGGIARLLSGCQERHRNALRKHLWPYEGPGPRSNDVAETSPERSEDDGSFTNGRSSDVADTSQTRSSDVDATSRTGVRGQGSGVRGQGAPSERTTAHAHAREEAGGEPDLFDRVPPETPGPAKSRRCESHETPLPDFVPSDAWEGFVAHRKALRKPLTDRGRALLIGKLVAWHGQGHDVGKLLDEATERRWLAPVDPAERHTGPARHGGNGRREYSTYAALAELEEREAAERAAAQPRGTVEVLDG